MPRVPYVTGWSPSSLLRKALSAVLIVREEDLGSKGERPFDFTGLESQAF